MFHQGPTKTDSVLDILSVGGDVEQPELSHIDSGCVNWYNHFGELFGNKTIPQYHSKVNTQDKCNICSSGDIYYNVHRTLLVIVKH